jgi:hypothetical protein
MLRSGLAVGEPPMQRFQAAITGAVLLLISTAANANLLVNGNFSASTSETATPPGWTQLGPSDGVIQDSLFGTPAYHGYTSYYDLGGFGDAYGTVGDGLEQTVATTPGVSYVLTFGLASENSPAYPGGTTTLTVSVGGTPASYVLAINPSYGELAEPWTTEVIAFVASGTSTLISFVETANNDGGNNDPVIADAELSTAMSSTPLPSTWTMLIAGFAGLGFVAYRGKKNHPVAIAAV